MRMLKKLVSAFLITLLLGFAFPAFLTSTDADTFDGWQVATWGSTNYSESNGVITFGDNIAAGPGFYREISPQTDFEISLQVKAATIGEVNIDPEGAMEGFAFFVRKNISEPYGIHLELRGVGGGEFRLARPTTAYDFDWVPFLSDSPTSFGGCTYGSYSPLNRTGDKVSPNVWYTLNLKFQKNPFVVTAEVLAENGTLLGSSPASDMAKSKLKFEDIKVVGFSSAFGGEFSVKNYILKNISAVSSPPVKTFNGWRVAEGLYGIINGIQYKYGGKYSEFNGVMTLSGDERAAGPTLFKEISPTADFEISLQIKAETLSPEGGTLSGGSGEGFRLMLQDKGVNPTAGINFELRGRGGGEFWMAYHSPRCDLYGWQCDIVTFMSNSGDIYASQNSMSASSSPYSSSAVVKPGVWYTMKLTVHQSPYTMTSEVYAENGTLLGSLTIDDINNFSFNHIKAVVISSLCGGTFYVKNIAVTDKPTVGTLQGWHDVSTGGSYTVTDGVVSLTSNGTAGPVFEKEFRPQADFEISLQVKAKTLGELSLDPLGAGEGFGWGFGTDNVWPSYTISFEMGARSGGQFLLDYGHPTMNNSWDWDWTPFVYDGLEYNNGYAFWHSASTAINRTNAPVRADVWYTLKLKVTEVPFTVTSEVWSENGTLLGSLTWTNIHTSGLKDIRYAGIWSTHGGTFYVRNININDVSASFAQLSISAEPSSHVGSPVNIHGTLKDSYGNGLANESVVLRYSFPGVSEWYPISSMVTDAAGNYNVQWMTTATGTFTLRTEWKGNNMYPSLYADMTLNSLPFQNNVVFFVESNSTLTSLAFDSNTSELSFTVSGASGTTGYVKATIAKNLLPDAQNLKVNLDGNQLSYTLTENSDAWIVAFNYSHSTHRLTIDLPANAATPNGTATSTAAENALPAPNRTDSPRGIGYGVWIAITIAVVGLAVSVIAGGIALHRRKSSAPNK